MMTTHFINDAKHTENFLSPARLIILISGNGSNLQAIIDACHQKWLRANIEMVISNEPHAYGLVRAKEAGLRTEVIPHSAFSSRAEFEKELINVTQTISPCYIVLAGFMRILTPLFINTFKNRLINIHPSLLPKYQGLHTHKRALNDHETENGCSVHLVTEELDSGLIIGQAKTKIEAHDTLESLQNKVHLLEHKLYPLCLKFLIERTPIFSDKDCSPNLNDFLKEKALSLTNQPDHFTAKSTIAFNENELSWIYENII